MKRPKQRPREIAAHAFDSPKADYGVVRETVYAAKRKRKELAALLELEPKGRNMTGEELRNQIELHQRQAAKWRRPKRPRRSKSNLKPR